MNDKMKGIMFIILAGFFFSLMTLFVRLSGDLPTMQKVFFRNAIAAIVSIIMLAKSEEGFSIKKGSWPGLILRSLFGGIGMVCNFYAIDKLGLADSNMLNKMSPFFAIIMSTFILKEFANKVEWASVFLAFIGAVFIIKPSLNVTSFYGLIGLLGGFGAGAAYTFVRKLGKMGERGPVIVMFFSVFTTIFATPFFILGYKPMLLKQLAFLILAGIAAAGGQLSITKAYTKAAAKEISVFDYSQIIFATALGALFFGEIPDKYSFIGYVIIIGVAVWKWKYSLREEAKL